MTKIILLFLPYFFNVQVYTRWLSKNNLNFYSNLRFTISGLLLNSLFKDLKFIIYGYNANKLLQ
jgi:hypothetical protein